MSQTLGRSSRLGEAVRIPQREHCNSGMLAVPGALGSPWGAWTTGCAWELERQVRATLQRALNATLSSGGGGGGVA